MRAHRPLFRETVGLGFGMRYHRWRATGRPFKAARFEATGGFAIVHRCTRTPGWWQVSYFDRDGAIGDCRRPTLDKALRDSDLDHGYRLVEVAL